MERHLASNPADQARWMHRKSNRSNAPSDAARQGEDEATNSPQAAAMANQMMASFRFGPAPPAQPLPPPQQSLQQGQIIALPPEISWEDLDLDFTPLWEVSFPDLVRGREEGEGEGREESEDQSEEEGEEGMEEVFEM